MSSWGIIGTWEMSFDGIKEASRILGSEGNASDAIVKAIRNVEDNPSFTSVGFGGLPNENGEVQLDAAYMNGKTLNIGAVGAVKNVKNPILLARKLSGNRFNNFLVGDGAEEFATICGFEKKNMLSLSSKVQWEKRMEEVMAGNLSPYDGHDTVGMVALDSKNRMIAATSTSGLFMKHSGRLGDSAIVGSGFYVDDEIGGACATGLGEDIMKGCLSYEVVRRMGEGYEPEKAASFALSEFSERLMNRVGKVGAISIVCMNNKGEWGAVTNVEFTFVVATSEMDAKIYRMDKYGNLL